MLRQKVNQRAATTTSGTADRKKQIVRVERDHCWTWHSSAEAARRGFFLKSLLEVSLSFSFSLEVGVEYVEC